MCEKCGEDGPPPDVLQIIQERISGTARMAANVRRSELLEFLDGLTIEQIRIMRNLLNEGDMGESARANFYDGYLMGLGKHKHGMDPGTGQTAEEALKDLAEQG